MSPRQRRAAHRVVVVPLSYDLKLRLSGPRIGDVTSQGRGKWRKTLSRLLHFSSDKKGGKADDGLGIF